MQTPSQARSSQSRAATTQCAAKILPIRFLVRPLGPPLLFPAGDHKACDDLDEGRGKAFHRDVIGVSRVGGCNPTVMATEIASCAGLHGPGLGWGMRTGRPPPALSSPPHADQHLQATTPRFDDIETFSNRRFA